MFGYAELGHQVKVTCFFFWRHYDGC